jgi:hypothetical protein
VTTTKTPPAPVAPATEETTVKPDASPDATPAPPVVTATTEPPVGPPAPTAEPPRYVPDLPIPPVPAVETTRLEQEYEDLTVEKHSVIGIRLDSAVSTRTARVEDRVTAIVSRDVTVNGRTAIPSGARLEGTVTLVERGGRFKTRPRLGLRFDRMILADGTRVSISTDTIYREGENPTADSTAKVGAGAVAGAILGAVIGGKKGAAIGTIAGAAGGAATVLKDDAGETSLAAGAPLTVRLTEDVVVTVNR